MNSTLDEFGNVLIRKPATPGMDMISLGPTLQYVHSPDERLEVLTASKVYDLLTETLMRVPVN
jgi:dipeptidase D